MLVPSVLGLVEEREAGARLRAERLRGEAARLAGALGEAEAELSRLVIARETLREVLNAGPGDRGGEVAIGPAGTGAGGGIRVSVPVRESGMGLTALPGVYWRLAQALEASPEPLAAGELTRLLGYPSAASDRKMALTVLGCHGLPLEGLPYMTAKWSAGESSFSRFSRAASLLAVMCSGSASTRRAMFRITSAACGCSSTRSILPPMFTRT